MIKMTLMVSLLLISAAVCPADAVPAAPASPAIQISVDILRAPHAAVQAFQAAHPNGPSTDLLAAMSVDPDSAVRTVTVTTEDGVDAAAEVSEIFHTPTIAGYQDLSSRIAALPHRNPGGAITVRLTLSDTEGSVPTDPETPRHVTTDTLTTTRVLTDGETLMLPGRNPRVPPAPGSDPRDLLFFVTASVVKAQAHPPVVKD